MTPLLTMLADGFFAAVAAMGFAVISNPPKKVVLVAGALAAVGHMGRFALMREGVGIASASLCAALLISLCSMPALAHSGGDVRLSRAPAHDSGHVRL